jgi:hypothetical protein
MKFLSSDFIFLMISHTLDVRANIVYISVREYRIHQCARISHTSVCSNGGEGREAFLWTIVIGSACRPYHNDTSRKYSRPSVRIRWLYGIIPDNEDYIAGRGYEERYIVFIIWYNTI